MNLLQLIATCRHQIRQIETDADMLQLPVDLRLSMTENMKAARSTLTQAEKWLVEQVCDNTGVGVAKLRLWERKLLDLTLRNNLLNMRLGKNAQPLVFRLV